ncbi:MAG: hypothetical protein IJV16_10810 [Lachnospiraceae bacterium]|nr:hypothetical protein [Lachnospiraceae bacterium]
MTLTEIKKRCLEIMKARYPTSKYKYYSNAVVESFTRPCFFTELSVTSSEPASTDAERYVGQLSIEILQDVVDEVRALEIANTLRLAFGRYFMVNAGGGEKRAVRVNAYDFDFEGTDDNIPVITIDLEWYDSGLLPSETADIMDGIDVSIKVETED